MPDDHVPTREIVDFDAEGNPRPGPASYAEAGPLVQRWTLTLQDPDDPYAHSARARQRTTSRWDVEYFRRDELVSHGGISTPPPHEPPFTTLSGTLRELRAEADQHGPSYLRPLDRDEQRP